MPRISAFYGIVIEIFHSDHSPPHFHASYGGESILVAIDPLRIEKGRLAHRAERLVIEWTALHQRELMLNWERAQRLETLLPIDPLP